MFKNFKKRIRSNPLFEFYCALPKEQGGIYIPILVKAVTWAVIAITGYFLVPKGLQKVLGEFGLQIVAGLSHLFLIIAGALFDFAADLLAAVLSSGFMQAPLTREPIVKMGFAMVRDIANMGIVLGFVVVGIATILRIREYEAQKALLPLILIAIFINFSLVFCGIIIDASNIIMDYFLNTGGAKTIVNPFKDMAKAPEVKREIDRLSDAKDHGGYAAVAFMFGLFLLIAAYTFIVLSIILLARQAMLMILLILSPLGFFCAVFKATKPGFQKWWNEFLKWCFVGVGSVFFIYLATHLIRFGIPGVKTTEQTQGSLGNLGFLVPIIFLLISAKIARSTSAMGASFTLGLAGAAAGFIGGKVLSATGGTAKGALKAAKESRVGQKVSRGVSLAKEKLGLSTAGATKRLGAEQSKEYAKDLQNASNEQLVKNATSRTNAPRAAAALDQLRERGKLDMLPQNKMGTLMAKAEQFGYKRSDFEKADPTLAKYNTKTINEIMSRRGHTGGRTAAEKIAVKESVQKLDIPAVRKLSLNTLKNIDVVSNFTAKQAKALERGTPAQISEMKNHLPSIRTRMLAAHRAANMAEFRRLNTLRGQIMAL